MEFNKREAKYLKNTRRESEFLITFLLFILFCATACKHQFAEFQNEIALTRSFMIEIVSTEKPSSDWLELCDHSDPQQMFYFFKVWFVENQITVDQVKNGKILIASQLNNGRTGIDILIKKDLPEIRSILVQDHGKTKLILQFPMNNCTFTADKNHDGSIDAEDVSLVKVSL